jgi:hypothetical protein
VDTRRYPIAEGSLRRILLKVPHQFGRRDRRPVPPP